MQAKEVSEIYGISLEEINKRVEERVNEIWNKTKEEYNKLYTKVKEKGEDKVLEEFLKDEGLEYIPVKTFKEMVENHGRCYLAETLDAALKLNKYFPEDPAIQQCMEWYNNFVERQGEDATKTTIQMALMDNANPFTYIYFLKNNEVNIPEDRDLSEEVSNITSALNKWFGFRLYCGWKENEDKYKQVEINPINHLKNRCKLLAYMQVLEELKIQKENEARQNTKCGAAS